MQLLTWDELANMLSISKRSAHRLKTTDADFPKPLMVSKSVRFKKSDVEEYIEVLANREQEDA